MTVFGICAIYCCFFWNFNIIDCIICLSFDWLYWLHWL